MKWPERVPSRPAAKNAAEAASGPLQGRTKAARKHGVAAALLEEKCEWYRTSELFL